MLLLTGQTEVEYVTITIEAQIKEESTTPYDRAT
jgi:hypothetical protein